MTQVGIAGRVEFLRLKIMQAFAKQFKPQVQGQKKNQCISVKNSFL